MNIFLVTTAASKGAYIYNVKFLNPKQKIVNKKKIRWSDFVWRL